MDAVSIAKGINATAEMNRPARAGDWYNDKGILMCGKCNAPLEFIFPASHWDNKPIPEDKTEEQVKAMRETRAWFTNRKLRIVCKCVERERRAFERNAALEALKERQCDCFGNQYGVLTRETFSRDDGRNPRRIGDLRRYVAKYPDMRAKVHGLILHGASGSGKTFGMLSILNNLINNGYRAVYTSVYKVLTKTSPYISAQTVINSYHDADIIGIDEVEEECLSGKNFDILTSLINSARVEGIPVVIGTRMKDGNLERLHSLCRNTSKLNMEEK